MNYKIMISKDRKRVKLIFSNQNKNTNYFEIKILIDSSYQEMIDKQHESIQYAYKEAKKWIIKNYPELMI